jgi:hypothetical protein
MIQAFNNHLIFLIIVGQTGIILCIMCVDHMMTEKNTGCLYGAEVLFYKYWGGVV